MRSITTTIAEKIGKRMSNRHSNIIDEGISINEFTKMMNKVKRSGVNLNSISGTKLMFYLYNTMPKSDFQVIAHKVEDIDPKDMQKMKTPVSCGGGYSCGDDGYSCGSPRRHRRSYSCGYDDDDRC